MTMMASRTASNTDTTLRRPSWRLWISPNKDENCSLPGDVAADTRSEPQEAEEPVSSGSTVRIANATDRTVALFSGGGCLMYVDPGEKVCFDVTDWPWMESLFVVLAGEGSSNPLRTIKLRGDGAVRSVVVDAQDIRRGDAARSLMLLQRKWREIQAARRERAAVAIQALFRGAGRRLRKACGRCNKQVMACHGVPIDRTVLRQHERERRREMRREREHRYRETLHLAQHEARPARSRGWRRVQRLLMSDPSTGSGCVKRSAYNSNVARAGWSGPSTGWKNGRAHDEPSASSFYCIQCVRGNIARIIVKDRQTKLTYPLGDLEIPDAEVDRLTPSDVLAKRDALVQQRNAAATAIQTAFRSSQLCRKETCPVCLDDDVPHGLMEHLRHVRADGDDCACCRKCWSKQIAVCAEEGKLHVRCPLYHECKSVLNDTQLKLLCGAATLEQLQANRSREHGAWIEELRKGEVDPKFLDWANENTRFCPACKAITWRYAGCSSMTCVCGTHYSWDDPMLRLHAVIHDAESPGPEEDVEGDGEQHVEQAQRTAAEIREINQLYEDLEMAMERQRLWPLHHPPRRRRRRRSFLWRFVPCAVN